MRTITLVINTPELNSLRHQQTKLIRRAYGLARNGHTFNAIHGKLQQDIDGHLFRSGIQRGIDLAATGHKKIIFGGRKNFIRRCKNLITNQDWKDLRSEMPLYSVGQANAKGNRRFRIDYKTRTLTYKDSENEYSYDLPVLKPNWEIILAEISRRATDQDMALMFSVGRNKIDITYDEQRLDCYKKKYRSYVGIKSRYLGIDLNPDRVGVAIYSTERGKQRVIHAEQYELTSEDQNKRRNEISSICHEISKLMHHYRVMRVGMEQLTIKTKDHGKGRRFNKKVNHWIRTFIVAKLRMICSLSDIQFCNINPAYSSFIGTLSHPELGDCCGAAAEIARRCGYKSIDFYPKLISASALEHRWKEMAGAEVSSWKELYEAFKTRHMGWRSPPRGSRSSVLGAWSNRLLVHPL